VNRLEATLVDVVARFDHLGVGCGLVGGLAVSVRAEPRFTRDVDLAVMVADDRAAETLVNRFLQADFGVLATIEQEAVGRLATVRLLPPGQTEDGVVVDLLFASSGVEPEIVRSAEKIEVFPSVVIPVASVAHLIALKILARDDDRPQDEVDLRALLLVASEADISEAARALDLVTERGFARDRDLEVALRSAVTRWRPTASSEA